MVVLKQTQTAPLKIRWLIGVVPLVVGTSVPVVIDDSLKVCHLGLSDAWRLACGFGLRKQATGVCGVSWLPSVGAGLDGGSVCLKDWSLGGNLEVRVRFCTGSLHHVNVGTDRLEVVGDDLLVSVSPAKPVLLSLS